MGNVVLLKGGASKMMKSRYVLLMQAALVLPGCGSEQKVFREGIPSGWLIRSLHYITYKTFAVKEFACLSVHYLGQFDKTTGVSEFHKNLRPVAPKLWILIVGCLKARSGIGGFLLLS